MIDTDYEFLESLQRFERDLQQALPDVYCPVHLCLGAEEVPLALRGCLRREDWLFASHRAHGHYMARGGDMQALWDEIMGLETGINGGFSGSQEFSDEARHFHCSAIVGGLIGVATGAALAMRLAASGAIVVCVFGDAGVEQGVAWESFNFAALHKLPIAYICENNGMSVDSPIAERQARPIGNRVGAFGVYVRHSVEEAIESARAGIPSFYEAKVRRDCDHLNMKTMPVGSSGGM